MTSTRRATLPVAIAFALIAPMAVWAVYNNSTRAAAPALGATQLAAAVTPVPPNEPQTARRPISLPELLNRDPAELIELAREKYQRDVQSYRAVLTKQEMLPDGLSLVQEIELRYRENPKAVYMIWKRNATSARRALFMHAPDFVDKKGRLQARVEPHGTLVRLVTTDVYVLIHGADAKKSSRRTIDEAGFASTMALFEKYNSIARERGVLNLRSGGVGEIAGRPTFVILRDLPYEGPDGPYPDARLVMHVDQEHLLPIAVFSYADAAQTQLLGSYVFTDIELNPDFGDDAFAF